MPANPHPSAQWFADRNATEGLSYTKLHERVIVADANEVHNTDFSGQVGGLYIRALTANFNLDTTSVAADDGSTTIIDGAGNHFIRTVDSTLRTKTKHTTVGVDVTIADADTVDVHEINNTGAVGINVFLPSVAVRTTPIRIVDVGNNALTFNITVKPKAASGQTIMGGSQFVLDSNGSSLSLEPNSDLTGYV